MHAHTAGLGATEDMLQQLWHDCEAQAQGLSQDAFYVLVGAVRQALYEVCTTGGRQAADKGWVLMRPHAM